MKSINYEYLFNRFYHDEYEPTDYTLQRIAHEIKTNNISTEDIYI